MQIKIPIEARPSDIIELSSRDTDAAMQLQR